MWSFLSFRKFKQQTSILQLQIFARSSGIMSYSKNRNDLSGECYRKPSPPPTLNNRTAWKKIQATWDACFLAAQAGKAQALALTLFSVLDRFPESLMPNDIMLAAAARSQVGAEQRKLLHGSSFSHVELWANPGKQAAQAGVCVLFSSSGKKENKEKDYVEFSHVFCPNSGGSMAADRPYLWLCKVRSGSMRDSEKFLSLFKSLAQNTD